MAGKNEWDSTLTFMLAMIGSAVGLGNIWRFPYIAYSHGGSNFILPYLVAIITVGIPFIYVEYGVGYKYKASLSKILKQFNEKFEFIGWFILAIPYLILTYYACIIGWNIIYLILSFSKGWGTDTETFFSQTLLHSTSNPMGICYIVLPIFISVIVVWLLIWSISRLDINEGLGKVCKILIPLLFIIMIGIVLYSYTLPGASIGIYDLFAPPNNLNSFIHTYFNIDLWLDAFGQIVFSLSLGLCIMLTYASYLSKNENLIKNGLIVALANCSFELFTATGIFSILGFMSLKEHIPVNNLIQDGAGLAFIALPKVFNVMGIAGYVIGPLFFICLFFAAFTSALALVEPLSSALIDKFNISRKKATTLICGIGFLISIIFTSSYGVDLLTYFDQFLNQFGLLLTIILECVIFAWIYKIEDIIEILNKNSNIKLGRKWKFIIKYFIPIIVGVLWINGNFDTFITNNHMQTIIQLIIFATIIIIPLILTKMSPRSKKY